MGIGRAPILPSDSTLSRNRTDGQGGPCFRHRLGGIREYCEVAYGKLSGVRPVVLHASLAPDRAQESQHSREVVGHSLDYGV